MKLLLKNTMSGLIPLYDTDFDEKKKLKIGEIYKVTITKARNVQLHRKYFALFNCAWEYLTDEQQKFFGLQQNSDVIPKDQFRYTVQSAAGHCDKVFSLKLREWVDIPKTISFEKMDEFEFRELYHSVKDVIFSVFLKHISIDEFESELINF